MRTTPSPGGVDPEIIATRQEFAAALTAVRETAGLTVREVARAAGIRPSTVGGYFSGRHLPPLRPEGGVRAILAACGVTDPDEVDDWQRTLARVRRAPGPRPRALPPPYRGLSAYRVADAGLFHGREAEVRLLADRLVGPPDRIVVLHGAPGSGRTSLVAAGLVPHLRSAGRRVALVTPGPSPLQDLQDAVADLDGAGPPGVLVVDDIDDLVNQRTPEHPEGHAFLGRLATGAIPTLVVLGTRSLATFARSLDLSERTVEAIALTAPDGDALRSIILGPARAGGVDVDAELVEEIVGDVATLARRGDAVLPRLSHALLATWRHDGRGRLTTAGYRAVGGVSGSVGQAAESVADGLDDAARTALASQPESAPSGPERDAVEALARELAAAGLFDLRDGRCGPAPVGLIQGWPRARMWWPEPPAVEAAAAAAAEVAAEVEAPEQSDDAGPETQPSLAPPADPVSPAGTAPPEPARHRRRTAALVSFAVALIAGLTAAVASGALPLPTP